MRWPTDITEARKIQEAFRDKVKITPFKGTPEHIAGVDAAFLGDKPSFKINLDIRMAETA